MSDKLPVATPAAPASGASPRRRQLLAGAAGLALTLRAQAASTAAPGNAPVSSATSAATADATPAGIAAGRPRLLLLGVYHFANPGRDVAKQADDDILAPERQRSLEQIAEAVARFAPTMITVEQDAAKDEAADQRYADWLAGKATLGRSEIEQLGFRLRRRLGLGPLRGINWGGQPPGGDFRPYDYPAWTEDQATRGNPAPREALRGQRQTLQAWASEVDRAVRAGGPAAALRLLNSPARLAESHRRYFDYLRFGDADWAAGANYLGNWMTRNLRMFENLRQASAGQPRVLLIVGAGHVPLLQRYAADSQSFELASALDFLP
ncbi:DUF5694 domain-containing protein [Roseateles sp.]|uniref:DUF5694 domain-containing protein n=1 Tax=Roseateles sp. TaxID=1971397 RepID=UPI0031E10B42